MSADERALLIGANEMFTQQPDDAKDCCATLAAT